MSETLKYIAYIVMAGAAVFIVSRVRCDRPDRDSKVFVPADSSFVPVEQQTYRPPSTPFERPSKPVQRLPKGVEEEDVWRVIQIVRGSPGRPDQPPSDTTIILETKSGDIYVPKQDSVEISVLETRYIPPILSWGLFPSVGVSVPGEASVASPLAMLAPLQVYGVLELPAFMLDLEGVGAGAGVKYRSFLIGAGGMWRFRDAGRQFKLFITYSL